MFPGNSVQGTLGLYIGHHYCHTHLMQLAFPNKPQQVNTEPRESDVRHELKLKRRQPQEERFPPTPGISGAEMTWDFRPHMPPVTQDRKWRGEDLKMSALSSLARTMET